MGDLLVPILFQTMLAVGVRAAVPELFPSQQEQQDSVTSQAASACPAQGTGNQKEFFSQ